MLWIFCLLEQLIVANRIAAPKELHWKTIRPIPSRIQSENTVADETLPNVVRSSYNCSIISQNLRRNFNSSLEVVLLHPKCTSVLKTGNWVLLYATVLILLAEKLSTIISHLWALYDLDKCIFHVTIIDNVASTHFSSQWSTLCFIIVHTILWMLWKVKYLYYWNSCSFSTASRQNLCFVKLG